MDKAFSLSRIADLLFEVGMLQKTPRSGFQFLGSGCQSVAEHSFRTAVIGYVLAKMSGADLNRVVLMALFHDLPEARTGDFNYVNRIYDQCQDKRALADALQGTGLLEIHQLLEELEEAESEEARLAQDADQLELILTLKQELDLGNPYAAKWLEHALKRLRTCLARDLALVVMQTDHTDWWFKGPDQDWWSRKNGSGK